MNKYLNYVWFALGLIAFSVIARIIPHPPNFTPILSMALFSAFAIKDKRWALVLPIIAMAISDIFIGWHVSMLTVYVGVLSVGCLGLVLAKTKRGELLSMTIGSVVGPLLFFIISNAGVWLLTDMYPKSMSGLLASFVAGLPFLYMSVAGTLLYSAVLFGALVKGSVLLKGLNKP